MKVCLVFPPYRREDQRVIPPLRLLRLSTFLKDKRVESVIIDCILLLKQGKLRFSSELYSDIAEMIADTDSDIIGFSAQWITLAPSLNIARRCKELNPNCTIVLGGHSILSVDKEILKRFPFIDIIVRGEGEITLWHLAETLGKGDPLRGIKGITSRENKKIYRNEDRDLIQNLDDLPFPSYEFVPSLQEYDEASNFLSNDSPILIEDGRGCFYNCIFCELSRVWKRRLRQRSVENIGEELRNLKRMYQIDEVTFTCDLFTGSREWVERLCELLIKEDLHIKWRCRSRFDTVDPILLQEMKGAGCKEILYGAESGSPRILRFIRKNLCKERVIRTLQGTVRCGISPNVSFVIGLPCETRESLEESLKLALFCSVLVQNIGEVKFHLLTVLPGTDLFTRYRNELSDANFQDRTSGIRFYDNKIFQEDAKLIREFPDLFCSFYDIRLPCFDLDYIFNLSKTFNNGMRHFPLTLFTLLNRENTPVIDFYDKWLEWAEEEGLLKNNRIHYSSQRLADCFSKFLKERIAGSKQHLLLSDLLLYDSLLKDFLFLKRERNMKASDMLLRKNQIEFNHDISDYVANIKECTLSLPARAPGLKKTDVVFLPCTDERLAHSSTLMKVHNKLLPNRKNIVFLEKNRNGYLGFISAKRCGYNTIYVTRNQGNARLNPHEEPYVDALLDVDTNDEWTALEAVRQLNRHVPIHAVVTFHEYYVCMAARIASELGLHGLSLESVKKVRNKALMRDALAEHNVPVPRYEKAKTAEEAEEAAKMIGFPCILKPSDETASCNVLKTHTMEEVKNHFDIIKRQRLNSRGQWISDIVLVEECIEGPEYSVESICFDNEVSTVTITAKLTEGAPYRFIEMGHTLPADITARQYQEIEEVAVSAIKALGIHVGATHTEIKLSAKGPRIIEIAGRLGGDRIPELINLVYGTDIYRAVLEAALGIRPELAHLNAKGAAAVRFLSSPPGNIVEIRGVEESRLLKGVKEVTLDVEKGSTRGPLLSFYDRAGSIIAVGKNSREAYIRAEKARSFISFLVTN